MIFPKKQNGITLTELLIAGILLSVVFVAATSLYVSALKFFKSQTASADVNSLIALEHISRNIKKANDVAISGGGSQLKLRIEGSDPATQSVLDDQWVVYGVVSGKLYWKAPYAVTGDGAASTATDVTNTDPELVPGLTISSAIPFSLTNPSAQGVTNIVQIVLVTTEGNPSKDNTITTSVMIGSKSK